MPPTHPPSQQSDTVATSEPATLRTSSGEFASSRPKDRATITQLTDGEPLTSRVPGVPYGFPVSEHLHHSLNPGLHRRPQLAKLRPLDRRWIERGRSLTPVGGPDASELRTQRGRYRRKKTLIALDGFLEALQDSPSRCPLASRSEPGTLTGMFIVHANGSPRLRNSHDRIARRPHCEEDALAPRLVATQPAFEKGVTTILGWKFNRQRQVSGNGSECSLCRCRLRCLRGVLPTCREVGQCVSEKRTRFEECRPTLVELKCFSC